MKRNKGMQLGAMLLAMFLLAIVLIPAVSAQKVGNEGNEYDSTKGVTPYATINAYGPSDANTTIASS